MSAEIDVSDSLRFRYMTANTPSYLFRHFASDPLIQDLMTNCAMSQLEDMLNLVLSNMNSADDAVRAYVLVVAIAMKGGSKNSFSIPWWDQLMELARARSPSFSISCADFSIYPTARDLGALLNHRESTDLSAEVNGEEKCNISLTTG
jgi:hypothetical protein